MEWLFSASGLGRIQTTNEAAYVGKKGLQTIVTMLGYQIQYLGCEKTIDVNPGGTYALSGFCNARQVFGALSIDLRTGNTNYTKIPLSSGDSIRFESGNSSWQFGWATFSVPNDLKKVTVRIMHTNLVEIGERGFIDEIAVTPVDQFVPFEQVASLEASLGISMYPGLKIEGSIGRRYRVEGKRVSGGEWQVVTNLFLPSTPYFFIDLSAGSEMSRIYRVIGD